MAAAVPNTGSYASFTHHGQSYGYNHGVAHGHGEPLYRRPASPSYKPTTTTTEAPKYEPKPEPTYAPEPAYKPRSYPDPAYKTYKPEPAYKPYKPEPAYKPYQPAYPRPAYPSYPSYHKPSYGYEQPKHNCSVEDVTEDAEVCTPTLETSCENVELPIKKIVEGEYCYEVARTVCTESTETVDNEVCVYDYSKKYEDTEAQTVEVTFKRETDVQMVTVCQPGYGHGYHSYGHQYCKEVAQETQYNVPVVSPIDVPVRVGYPEAIKTCTNKPITLPRLSCEVVTEEKCVVQPEIEEATISVEKCTTKLGEPKCENVELTLPKQVCVELVYGYAEEKSEHYASQ